MATTTTVNKKAPKAAGKKKPALKKGAGKAPKPTIKKSTLTLKNLLMKAQYVTDSSGKKTSVLLPVKIFEKMLEDLEELEDIRLYDEAKRAGGKSLPMEEAFRRIDARRKKA